MEQTSKRRHRWITWCLVSTLLALFVSAVAIDGNARLNEKQRKLEAIQARNAIRYIIVPQPEESPFRLLAASGNAHSE